MTLGGLELVALAAIAPVADSSTTDPYSLAFEEAADLEGRGRYGKAARVLEGQLSHYPQDYALVLQAAWMRFQAHHYQRATRHYERAVQLSGGATVARLGLAWSLLYDGHKRQAVAALEQLAAEHPDDRDVVRALRAARAYRAVRTTVWASTIGQVYGSHPVLQRGLGVAVGQSSTFREHVVLTASYAYARLAADVGGTASDRAGAMGGKQNGGGPNGGGTSGGGTSGGQMGMQASPIAGTGAGDRIDQHQVHAGIGAVWPVAGGVVQYGYLRGNGVSADRHVVGTSLRWSPLGDLGLEASLSFGDIDPVFRVAPGWSAPIGRMVRVRPAFALQASAAEILPMGMLTATVQGRPGALWAGGKYGRERGPASLDVPVIVNLADEIRWGASLGGRVRLPAGFGLFATYEVDGLQAYDAGNDTTAPAQAHFITLGIDWTPA